MPYFKVGSKITIKLFFVFVHGSTVMVSLFSLSLLNPYMALSIQMFLPVSFMFDFLVIFILLI